MQNISLSIYLFLQEMQILTRSEQSVPLMSCTKNETVSKEIKFSSEFNICLININSP